MQRSSLSFRLVFLRYDKDHQNIDLPRLYLLYLTLLMPRGYLSLFFQVSLTVSLSIDIFLYLTVLVSLLPSISIFLFRSLSPSVSASLSLSLFVCVCFLLSHPYLFLYLCLSLYVFLSPLSLSLSFYHFLMLSLIFVVSLYIHLSVYLCFLLYFLRVSSSTSICLWFSLSSFSRGIDYLWLFHCHAFCFQPLKEEQIWRWKNTIKGKINSNSNF